VIAAVRGAGATVVLEVLEPLRGDPGPVVRLAADAAGQHVFHRGAMDLVLLRGAPGSWSCDPSWRQAKVDLEAADRRPAAALVRGVLSALAAGTTGSPAFRDFLERSLDIRNPALRAGVRFDLGVRLTAGDLPFLTGLAFDRSRPEDVRAWAVTTMARIAAPELPDGLPGLLAPSEPVAVREAVLQTVAARGGAQARDVLARGLADPSPAVRRVAVDNLSGAASVPLLAARFDGEPDPSVRTALVERLGQIGGPEAAGALRSILARPLEPATRRTAERALALARAGGMR
jgi:HEAT repeat protein